MRKFLLPGIVAALFMLVPSRSQAVPIDVPYVTLISTFNTGSVVISSANFPNANSTVNGNLVSGNYQWCINHVIVSGNATQDTFTMAWSTASFQSFLAPATTDYKVVITTAPYDEQWSYRQPYCSPPGQAVLTLTSSVAAAVIQVEGYLFKGWNP